MSSAWIEMAREQITSVLAGEDLGGIDFLRRENAATIGVFVRVADGRVEVGDRPIDDADLRIVSDYADALSISCDPDAPARYTSTLSSRTL